MTDIEEKTEEGELGELETTQEIIEAVVTAKSMQEVKRGNP